MTRKDAVSQIPIVGDGSGLWKDETFSRQELQLAFRNRGMPLEGLRYSVTPTGMHYLLTHYDIPYVNANDWRLRLDGLVNTPKSLTLDEIRERPQVTIPVTMECAGNGRALMTPRPLSQPWLHEAIGTAEWTGTPLKGVLEEAGLNDEAVEILFTGLDRGVEKGVRQYYQRSLTVSEATRDEMMLVYEMNGEPLQPQHGYPLRLLVPGWYGMTSVKWLHRIEAVSEPFEGYQMQAYSYRQSPDEPGKRVDLIKVRALMVPPGIPDFLTRTRLVESGPVILEGKAWAGRLGVSRVEVSADGGRTWVDATLGEQVSRFAWRSWSFEWNAAPGRYSLCVRATDTNENVQPIEQAWNRAGMGNNMSQQVDVIVE
jgi:DMSO/TMAO reductase YedYZ molybdopterin-dependent catalytic subunit